MASAQNAIIEELLMKPRQLSKEAFAQAIAQGAGRAFLHVKEYGDQDVREILLDACLHDYVYDHLFNSGRAEWLASIIDRTDDISYYAQEIKSAVLKFRDNKPSDNDQLLDLAVSLFTRGFTEFKPLLLELAETELAQKCAFSTGAALIDIAGYSGLHKAIQLLEKSGNATSWDRRLLFDQACVTLEDKQDTINFLEQQSGQDPLVHKYWANVQKQLAADDEPREYSPPPDVTLPEILEEISSERISKTRLWRFGKTATEADLHKVLRLIDSTQDTKLLATYLQIFQNKPMPVIPDRVFMLLEHQDSKVRFVARGALREIRSPVVRETALRMLNQGLQENIACGMDLLRQNYESTDAPHLLQSLQQLRHNDFIHQAGLSILDIASRTADKSLTPLLYWMQDTQPCAYCRGNALEELVTLDCAPEQLLFEAQWDCEHEIRMFARGQLATA